MTIEGYGLYGLTSKSWNLDATIAFINSRPNPVAISFLDTVWPNSFNPGQDPRIHINHLVAECPHKIIAIEPHVYWFKDHATNQHAICPLDILEARSKLWNTWATNHAGIRTYISHTLEYSEKSISAIQQRVDCIKKYAPLCVPVNSPMGTAPFTAGTINEEHTNKATTKGNQIANFDGSNCYDEDVQEWLRHNTGLINFMWCEECNGAESGGFVECFARTNFPGKDLFSAMGYMYDPPQPKPESPLTLLPLVKPNLYKVCGEDEKGKDPRDLKPMLWVVGHGRSPAKIVTFDGKHVLGELISFDDERRYAGLPGGINKWGYQIAQKAIELSGSPYVAFQVDDKFYGLEDAGRRGDFFQ